MDKTDKILKQFGKSEVSTVVPIGSDVIIPNNSAVKKADNSLYSSNSLVVNNGTVNFITGIVSGINGLIGTTTAHGIIFRSNNTSRCVLSSDGRFTIGSSTAYTSCQLAVDSTTKAFRPPIMTTAQKNAIPTPSEGMQVYDLDLHKMCVYTGAAWETITSA